MVPGNHFRWVLGQHTGDADYYAENGDIAMQVRAGETVYTNDKYVQVVGPTVANADLPEAPEKKPKEPFWAPFAKKKKNDYLKGK